MAHPQGDQLDALHREILRRAEEAQKRAELAERRAEQAEATRDEYLAALQAKDADWQKSKFYERLKVYRQRANAAREVKKDALEAVRGLLEVVESNCLQACQCGKCFRISVARDVIAQNTLDASV
jgi:hypothetical protein